MYFGIKCEAEQYVKSNLNWTMPKILKLQKLLKVAMALSICWTYLSDEPTDNEKKNLAQTVSYWDYVSTIE